MRPSRRHFLRTGAVAVPALACAALLVPGTARAAGEAGPGAFGGGRRADPLPGPAPADPAACPFCQPGNPCPAHMLQ